MEILKRTEKLLATVKLVPSRKRCIITLRACTSAKSKINLALSKLPTRSDLKFLLIKKSPSALEGDFLLEILKRTEKLSVPSRKRCIITLRACTSAKSKINLALSKLPARSDLKFLLIKKSSSAFGRSFFVRNIKAHGKIISNGKISSFAQKVYYYIEGLHVGEVEDKFDFIEIVGEF